MNRNALGAGSPRDSRPEVSVLIPVFNAERYLDECLESARRQTLEPLEIVCVNDGSEDGSSDIIRRHQIADHRIRVVAHERNRGEGAARNTGLEAARGRYVFHLDADDCLPHTALERLWATAERHGSEMVKGGFSMIAGDGKTLMDNLQSPGEIVINTSLAASAFLRRIPGSHCSYLYDRAFLNQHGLRYRTDMSLGLDLVALSAALTAAQRVSLIPEVVYHYRQTPESATRGSVTLSAVSQDLKTKRLVHGNLYRAAFVDAARDVLQAWDWHISEYWKKLPDTVDPEVAKPVLDAIRSMIPEGLVPWKPKSPIAHRYFMTLILQGRDAEAIEFLGELKSTVPFENSPVLAERCAAILAVAPDDPQAAALIAGIS